MSNKVWATGWGFMDALVQLTVATTLTVAVIRLFDIRGDAAFVTFLACVFAVMWAHDAFVLWVVNREKGSE